MRGILGCFIFFSFIFCYSCTPATEEIADQAEKTDIQLSEENGFDEELAEKLGADDYGMKEYVFAFLKTGPNRDQDSIKAAELQAAHLANISRLAEEGKLVLAGPFTDGNEAFRGIYIFNTSSVEEAKAFTETDPAIQAGRLVMELHTWYGSAALQKINDLHPITAKRSF